MLDNFIKYDNKSVVCLIDMETENLNLSFSEPVPNRPWQTSILVTQGKNILKEIDILTKWPNFKIGDGAAAVTGFYTRINSRYGLTMNKALDKHGKDQREGFKIMQKQLDLADWIVGHNILGFDLYLIIEWYKLNNQKWNHLIPKIIDTSCIAKGIKLEKPFKKGMNLISYQYEMNHTIKKGLKTNLTGLGKEYKIDFDYESTHDGIFDLQLNFEVFNKLKWMTDI